MNVAPSNAIPQSPPGRIDPAGAAAATRIVLGPDSGSIDVPVDGDATAGDLFGRMLSKGLIDFDGSGPAVAGKALPVDVRGQVGEATASDDLATVGITGFGVATSDPLDGEPATLRSPRTGDEAADPLAPIADGPRNDSAASDLAAQLALVSQWAGIAPPTVHSPGASDALDIQAKLDTVRAASALKLPSVAPAAVAAPDGPQDGRTVPGFALDAAPGARRTGRDVPSPAGATVANSRPEPARAFDVATATAPVDRPGLAVAAGKPEVVATRLQADAAITPADAFARLADVVPATVASMAPPSLASGPKIAVDTPTLNIQEPVGTPAWSREVGQATLRLAANDLQTASLQLNPQHLGPMDVQVRIDNGVAHLSFSAAHAETRQAIESSRTTLDQLFSDQGLKIGDCAVGDASTSRRGHDADAALADRSQRNGGGRWDGAAAGDAVDAPATTVTTRLKALGLVDTFA